MQEKSFVEYAFEVLTNSKGPLSFKELFDKALELSDLELSSSEIKNKMAKLYSSIIVDGRFANIDGAWDLSSRYTFEEIRKDYDEDEDDEEDDDDEEEKESLRQELGEAKEEEYDQDSDDLDFDKPQKDADDEDF